MIYPTTPQVWYKLQRLRAATEAEMDKITGIYEKWKDQELLVKIPFTINLPDGQAIQQKVYIIGYKTDGVDLYVEYRITGKGPKLTQVIK